MDELRKRIEALRKSQPSLTHADYKCKKCQDRGFIIHIDDRGYETAEQCECYYLNLAKKMMERSGISMEFREKTFDNFITGNNEQLVNAKRKAIGFVDSFLNTEHDRRNSIMFCGQVGSGKTHLGTAICSKLMSKGIAVIYMPYRNAITKIKQKILDESEYEKELIKYMSPRVLYIDDLIKGKITESDINIMYELINYRYMNNKPVIISTEKMPDELLEFDEAIGSRIIEMCRGNIIQLQGKNLNYRIHGGNERS